MNKKSDETKIIVLGGLGEVGKNMYCVMHEDEIIVIDAGVSFAEGELLGIDYVLPDYSFLQENEDKIKALLITHGHEDHVGLFEYIPNTIPQYMSAGTKELLSIKYGLLSEGASLNVDELQKNNCSSEEYSTAVNLYTQAENKCKLIKQMRTWYRTAPQKKPESIMIGDIKVTPFWHYKIFCVNRNTGFRKESRIFYFIHLQNEEDYERKESSSA